MAKYLFPTQGQKSYTEVYIYVYIHIYACISFLVINMLGQRLQIFSYATNVLGNMKDEAKMKYQR